MLNICRLYYDVGKYHYEMTSVLNLERLKRAMKTFCMITKHRVCLVFVYFCYWSKLLVLPATMA